MKSSHGPSYKPDKIIRIKECAGGLCPYLLKDNGGTFACGKDKRYRQTYEPIPRWCPLEDCDER